jgi:segregation and condensation protein A
VENGSLLTESSSPEPFWLHQPWRVLTDILDLQKVSPWEVDLAELVNGFIGRLLEQDYIDFRICGRALLSAAIILRFKTEYLLEFGREEEEAIRLVEEEIFLPPIRPPFRQHVRPTTPDELYQALRELVFPPLRHKKKARKPPFPTSMLAQFDVSQVELTKSMKQVYNQLCEVSLHSNPVSFFEFIHDMSHIEIIRVFLSLLYLMSDNKVQIFQDTDFGDIMITVFMPEGDGGGNSG